MTEPPVIWGGESQMFTIAGWPNSTPVTGEIKENWSKKDHCESMGTALIIVTIHVFYILVIKQNA